MTMGGTRACDVPPWLWEGVHIPCVPPVPDGKNYSIVERDYPNVTTLRSGLCYRKFVCLSSAWRLSNVGAPYSGVEPFGNISSPLCTLGIRDLRTNFTVIVSGEPPVWGAKRKRGSEIERWWTYQRLYHSHKGYKIDVPLLLKTYRKSCGYALCRMVTMPISLDDP